MSEPMILRPDPRAFLIRPVAMAITPILVSTIFLIGVLQVALDEPGSFVFLPPLFGILSLIAIALQRLIVFRKTRYEIHQDRIIHKTGGLLSERTTNLPFRNATQIGLTLPFLEHAFYKTARVTIHAAGSSTSIVRFQSIANSKAIYELLQKRLRQNGFSLQRQRLIQKERPGLLGVLLDGKSTGAFLGILLSPIIFLSTLKDLGFDKVETTQLSLIIALAMGLLAALTRAILSFIDRKERTYTLWDDCIEYEDGFMTHRYRIIPFENLADTNAEQSFLKRLFGMADLIISCQGTSGNIYFPSMPRAQDFRDNLDRLMGEIDGLAHVESAPTAPAEAAAQEDLTRPNVTPRFRLPTLGDPNRPGKTYRANPLLLAMPYLLAIPFILLIIPLVLTANSALDLDLPYLSAGLSMVMATATAITLIAAAANALYFWLTHTFTIGPRSISRTVELFTEKKTTEFTNDKITSITVRRSVFDRLFDTASISFYSIGAAAPLTFRSLPDYGAIQKELQEIFRVPAAEETPHSRIISAPTSNSLALTNIPLIIATGLVAAGFLVSPLFSPMPQTIALGAAAATMLITLLTLGYELTYHRRARLNLYEHHLMVQKGILNHSFCYIAYHDIKNISALKYPAQNLGALMIAAGGTSSGTSIAHIPSPFDLQDRLDALLYTRPMRDVLQTETFDTDLLRSWKPDAKNALIQNTLIATLTIVGIPLIPLLFLYTFAFYRRAEDILQLDRICNHRGVFFKRRNTVLINRIDQIQVHRGALNSLFRNGVVQIYTVGSGQAEALLGPQKEFQEVYDAVHNRTTG